MGLHPPIILQGELTPRDVRCAIRLAGGARWRMVLVVVLLAVFVLLFGAIGLSARHYDAYSGYQILVTVGVILPVLLLIPFIFGRYRLRRAWLNKTGVFRKVETTISTDGISFQQPYVSTQVGWPHFTKVRRSGSVLILFESDGWILFARSRFATDEDWQRFVSFVETRFASAGRA